MANTVSATDLKNKIADVLNRVVYAKSETIIVRHGKPIAVISPFKKEKRDRATIKKVIDDTFGAIPDFPEVKRRKSPDPFFSLAGILKDLDTEKMKRDIYKARRDGSRYKKFLAKW